MGIDTARSRLQVFIIAALLAACRAGCTRTCSAVVNPTPFSVVHGHRVPVHERARRRGQPLGRTARRSPADPDQTGAARRTATAVRHTPATSR
ncbi:MAG: hypothetical protein LKM38_30400 [Pseudomonas veronii]|nr:hypothetical protein [Pseudomonas veronii]